MHHGKLSMRLAIRTVLIAQSYGLPKVVCSNVDHICSTRQQNVWLWLVIGKRGTLQWRNPTNLGSWRSTFAMRTRGRDATTDCGADVVTLLLSTFNRRCVWCDRTLLDKCVAYQVRLHGWLRLNGELGRLLVTT